MSTKNESTYDDLVPKKLCSPPPKPPRRRHSDQSSTFSRSPLVYNKNKPLNGDFYLNAKTTSVTSSSGSESLPSNWVSGSPLSEKFKYNEPVKEVGNFEEKMLNFDPLLVEKDVCTNFPLSKSNNELHNSAYYKPEKQPILENCESHLHNYFLRNESSCICDVDSHICVCSEKISEKENEFFYKHQNDPLTSETGENVSSVSNAESLLENIPISIKDLGLSTVIENVHSNETKIQKEINDKLWQHLCLLQAKLDELNLSQASFEGDSENHPSFSELMVDIYKAQKEKDAALENRLNSALKLRDTAIKELDEVLQILVRSFHSDDTCRSINENNKELESFFQDLETLDHPVDILQKQHILLAYLYQIKERKIQQLSDAIKIAENERDKAISMMRNLEKEILDLRKSNRLTSSDEATVYRVVSPDDSDFTKPLKAQIVCHCSPSKLGGEIQPTNIIASFCDNCHALINDDYINWIDNVSDMELLKVELKNLSKLFIVEMQKRQSVEGNCLKLRQTLNYILDKFNGLNIGVPV